MRLPSSSAGQAWLMRAPIAAPPKLPSTRQRTLLALAALIACFVAIAAQLVRLGLKAEADLHLNIAEPIGQSWSRPDIVDRHGRLLATDVATHSLYADPQLVLDIDEIVEKLTAALAGLDARKLRKALGRQGPALRWIARGLTPRQAQRVHDLGLPGLAFRTELKRVYPLGALAGTCRRHRQRRQQGPGRDRAHGSTRAARSKPCRGPAAATKPALRLSLDIGVQHAAEPRSCRRRVARYSAAGAAGLVLDVTSGESLGRRLLARGRPRPSRRLAGARARRQADGRHLRARLGFQDADRRHGAGGRHGRSRQASMTCASR